MFVHVKIVGVCVMRRQTNYSSRAWIACNVQRVWVQKLWALKARRTYLPYLFILNHCVCNSPDRISHSEGRSFLVDEAMHFVENQGQTVPC